MQSPQAIRITQAIKIALVGASVSACSFNASDNQQVEPLALNDLQLIGSHNSYKRKLTPSGKAFLQRHDANKALNYDYSHPSLSAQLDLGLRHLEIDVLLDPDGGRFSFPKTKVEGVDPQFTQAQRIALAQPGLKVLHLPDVDYQTHCVSFVECLAQLRAWSDNNPAHLPIFILLNIKESGIQRWTENATEVLSFKADDYVLIDNAITQQLAHRLISPDTVRGAANSLNEAVTNGSWPSLKASRGKFVFIFDGNERQRELYRQAHPSLQGRAMFASYAVGEPEAAILVMNNPVEQAESISQHIAAGYIVRTRSDAKLTDGINNNTQRVQAALASGAQVISTDFYPGSPQTQQFGFSVSFEDGRLQRCNPQRVESTCDLNNN